MPIEFSPIGNNSRQDWLNVGYGGSQNFVTVTDAAGIRVSAPAPIEPPTAEAASAVASLSSVTDAASSALESLSSLSTTLAQVSAGDPPPYVELAAVGGDTPKAGTNATVADFGSITINDVTTVLGSVQAPYMTTQEASNFVATAINADQRSTVKASVDQGGFLQLTSKDGHSAINITAVGGSTTGEAAQETAIGFKVGSYGSSVAASAKVDGPNFAENFARNHNGTLRIRSAAAPKSDAPINQAQAPAAEAAQRPAPGPAGAGDGPAGADKGAAKKQGINLTAEPPARPDTATIGDGTELARAPATSANLGAAGESRGNVPNSEFGGLVHQIAQAVAASKGGQTVSDLVSRQTTQQVLQSLPLPPATLPPAAAGGGPEAAPDGSKASSLAGYGQASARWGALEETGIRARPATPGSGATSGATSGSGPALASPPAHGQRIDQVL